MKRITLLAVAVAVIQFGCAKSGPATPTPIPSGAGAGQAGSTTAPNDVAQTATPIVKGLTPEEREDFYHTPEGSALFPLDWLRVLRDKDTDRPFLENADRFGLLPDPNH